jgi:hypothetical protein
MRKLYYILWLLVVSFNCFSQAPDFLPVIDERYLPGLTIESQKIYNGASLYGYINGGAELYKEYGFSALKVLKIVYNNFRYTIEIYRMNGKEEAFGIFSVSRFNCHETPPLTRYTCQTPWQFQICKGRFYINIINNSGRMENFQASLQIGKSIEININENSADLSAYFPNVDKEIIDRKAILVKGDLGVMNGIQELSNFFADIPVYMAVILQDEEKYSVSVKFISEEDMIDFAARHRWGPVLFTTEQISMPDGTVISLIAEHHLLINLNR